MKIILASISARRKAKSESAERLAYDYAERAARYTPTETAVFDSEAALLLSAERQPGRPEAILLLCDSRGEQLSSPELATLLGRIRDEGAARLLIAIGPADGWSPSALARARKTIAFGRITLPHELARVVLAEQVYRALTILAGHPYHSGH